MRAKPVILVVDDQPQNIKLLQAYLVRQGYEIVEAANGKEALEKLSDNEIDLILLDVIMPGMDGFEVTRRIRQDNDHRLLPIILVTASREKEDRVKGIEAGCDDFISKPIDWVTLLARIRSLLKVKDYNDLMSNYRLVVENAREAIIITQDLKLVFVNSAFVHMIGYSEEILTSKTFTDFIHPDDRNLVIDHHLRKMKGGEIPSIYSFRVIHQDGTVKWAELNAVVIQWQGKPATLNFLSDITERKKAEIRILESEEKYRMLVENSSEAIFIAQDAMLKFVNRTSLEMFGSSYEVMTSIPFAEFIYAEDREMVLGSHLRRLRGETVHPVYAFRIVTREGIIRWVEIHSTVITWQGKPATLNFLTDITERKIVEERSLRKSQLLAAINRVFYETMTAESEKEVSQTCLNVALDLTGSQFGFIGKINPDGLFSTVALSDPGWEACLIPETKATAMIDNMVIRGIWGQVLLGERSLIVNDPASYPERVGLPQGHPPITSFLGVPLKEQKKIIGMIAVANRQSSYTDDHKQYLEVLSGAFVESIRRKQAEAALKESEKKYRDLYDFLPIPVYEMDLETNITSANRAIYETFRGTEENLQKGFKGWQLLSPEEVDKSARNIQKLLNGEQVSGTEYNLMKLDGSVFPAIVISSVIYSDNKPVGLRGAVIDITERKQAEDKLRESEERYGALFDRSRDLVYITDFEGRFIDANDAALNRLGYTREEIGSLNFASLLSEDQLPLALKILSEIQETGNQKELAAFRLRCKNGTYIYVETQGSAVLSNGAPVAIQAIARDITERRQTEDALRKSEEKYRNILETIAEGYYEVDLTGNFTFVNDSMCRIYGYTKGELLGLNYKRYFDKGTVEKMFRIFNEIYKTEKPSTEYSYELIRKDGVKRYIEASASLIKDATGRPTGFRGIVRDLTESRELREAIRQSEEKYRHIIEQMEDGYFEVDVAGKFTFVNDAECRNLGYSREEMIGMNNRQYSDKESQRKIFKAFSELYRTGVPIKAFEDVAIRKDGTIAINELSASLIRNSEGKAIGFRGIARDVTARKEMEEAIRQSEERYRTIIEQMEDGYFEIDLAGKFTFVNDAECRNLGYSREELIGMTSRLYADKEESEELSQIFRNIYDTGIPVKSYDLELVKKDGTKSYNEISAALIRDSEGKPVGFRGIARVVTERKKAEKALEYRMKQLAALSRTAQIVAASLDLDQVLQEIVSLAGEALGSDYTSVVLIDEAGRLSRSAENVPGLPVLDRRAREKGFTSWIMQSHQQVIIDEIGADGAVISAVEPGEGTPRFANPNLAAIGVQAIAGLPLLAKGRLLGVLYLHSLYPATFHNQATLLTTFANQAAIAIENARLYEEVRRELANRRQTEEALRESQKQLEEAYRLAHIGSWSWNSNNNRIIWSDEIYQMTGLNLPQPVFHDAEYSNIYTKESSERLKKALENIRQSGKPDQVELEIRRPDGRIIWLNWIGGLNYDNIGKLIGMHGTVQDITELKKAQTDLEETNLKLIKTYEELREKQAMVMQQEKMASIGLLAAGVAHEIKNPLAIMLQGVNYLQSTVKNDSLQTEVVERLHSAVQRADLIVKGLLSYARQDSVKLEDQNVETLIDDCLALTEHEFHKKNVHLIRQYAPDLPMVSVDGNQIKQVFVNLLINGIDAMPQGGTFTIDTRQIADNDGKIFLEIIFKDTGHGIPADMINKIFDPFYTTKTGGSTGLGLSISRGIIDIHGGTIHAESQIEQGTSMIIRLPLPL